MESFTARRSAHSNLNLPTFQLPPPPHLGGMHGKYQQATYAPSTSSQPTPAIASNILTPPLGVSNDGLSPLASSVNSGSSGSSAGGVPPYQPSGYWTTPGTAHNFNFSSAPSMPASFAQQNYMNRPPYPPAMTYSNRNPTSPTSGEGLPPPPYESLPPFTTSIPVSGSGGQQNLPSLAPQGQQHQMNNNGIMNMQQATSQPPQQGSVHASDNFGGRAPPTPGYYPSSSTPQQSNFPAYTQQSPTQQSPNTSSAPANRISPISGSQHQSMGAPQGYQPRPFAYNTLPALAAPILSNLHQPGSQMALLGGIGMPYGQHPIGNHMYGQHPGPQSPQLDRPFKCDQCPQSFNRNHDLKRHKRIHWAVKPFPCGHCDKSFSRKDALKRHVLVKGCGKGTTDSNQNGNSQSPVDKSEVMSDATDDTSPEMVKQELAAVINS